MLKLFDYRCEKCDTVTELLIKDNKPQICKKCGNIMTKLITNIGIVRGNFADKARVK